MSNVTRRLTAEEIKANLPKILAAHSRKTARADERKNVRDFQKKAAEVKVGESLGNKFREAYKGGTRFRGTNGRFLGLPKAS
jgi:hypothetical protein